MELFYSSGLRLAVLVSLDMGDIDPHEKMVEVTSPVRVPRPVACP
jgi:site-specific recombinase XerC